MLGLDIRCYCFRINLSLKFSGLEAVSSISIYLAHYLSCASLFLLCGTCFDMGHLKLIGLLIERVCRLLRLNAHCHFMVQKLN